MMEFKNFTPQGTVHANEYSDTVRDTLKEDPNKLTEFRTDLLKCTFKYATNAAVPKELLACFPEGVFDTFAVACMEAVEKEIQEDAVEKDLLYMVKPQTSKFQVGDCNLQRGEIPFNAIHFTKWHADKTSVQICRTYGWTGTELIECVEEIDCVDKQFLLTTNGAIGLFNVDKMDNVAIFGYGYDFYIVFDRAWLDTIPYKPTPEMYDEASASRTVEELLKALGLS